MNGIPISGTASGHPHSSKPLYATHAWIACKDLLDPQEMYEAAQSMRLEVMRESFRLGSGTATLLDIYTQLDQFYRQGVALKSPDPLSDFGDVLWQRRKIYRNEPNVWEDLTKLVDQLGIPNDQGVGNLLRACDLVGSDISVNDTFGRQSVDLFLSSGTPWKEVWCKLSPPAREHIKKHSSYRREKLMEISGPSGVIPAAKSAKASSRPVF